jgi:uncharacterized membrane protein (UPF0127 family)
MSRSPRHEVVVVRGDGGRIVCERCEVADTVIARARGLLGRKNLPSGAGLLIRPGFSIHTLFMRFPIDAVFLDRSGSVVDVVRRLKPWRAATRLRARAVLELPAGEAERVTLLIGERLEHAEPAS